MSLQLYNLSGAKVSEVSEVKDCEYGSNANGEYWKYANGLLICKANINYNINVSVQIGGFFSDSGVDTWYFPKAFNKNPTVKATYIPNGKGIIFDNDIKNTHYMFNIMQTLSSNVALNISLFAIGTWK